MASSSLSDLIPPAEAAVRALIAEANRRGIQTRVASTLRTCADQAAVYAQGRTTPGNIVSHAPGCRSWHLWGRAADIFVVDEAGRDVPFSSSIYDELGAIGKILSLKWGGDFWFRDAAHFEYHPDYRSIEDICPDPDRCEELVSGRPTPPVSLPKKGSRNWWLMVGAALGIGIAYWKTR